MRVALLMFVAGSAAVSLLPALPALHWLWLLVPAAAACLPAHRTRWLGALGLGIAWALIQCSLGMARRLPAGLEGKSLVLTGVVSSLPRQRGRLVQFRFKTADCAQCWAATTIKLGWYHGATRLEPGQRWRFGVRLNRPHGFANPGLFDYEGWLLGKGISATGYVIPGHATLLSGSGMRRLPDQLRYWLRARVLEALPDNHITRLLVALTVGQSSQVSAADWQTLSNTGTNHLLVISGLHIGLVAGISYRVLVRLLEWLVASPARWAGILSLMIAGFYGAIAGMGLPVQRALVMAGVAFSGKLLDRRVSTADMYCHALFLVTLLDPLAVLSTGFWLSFGAVFALLYAFAGRVDVPRAGRILHWALAALKTQWAVFVGMVPLLLYLVFQISLVAFLVNLVAIPWIGLLVIPLLLLAIPAFVVAPGVAAVIVKVAAASLALLWRLLAFAAAHEWVFHGSEMSVGALLAGLGGATVILAPRGLAPRWLGVLMLLPALAMPRRLAPGEVTVKILDVGEGLAVIVRSRDFRVVYQTVQRRGRFDTERQIVMPMLRRFGDAGYLDALASGSGVISRQDALVRAFLVGGTFSGSHGCRTRRVLASGPVRFVLLPVTADPGGNCALLVTSGDFALLLPGDIDVAGERQIMRSGLRSTTVLVAPGNGKRGSSSPEFLDLVAPRIAIFSTGYRNRFGHPNPAVVNRYIKRGITTYNTAKDGAILIDYNRESGIHVLTARGRRQRFWYD